MQRARAIAVPVALGVICGLILIQTDVSVPIKALVAVGFVIAAVGWNTLRELRLHAVIGRLSAQGEPQAMLEVIDANLGPRTPARMRIPLMIYKATAQWMQGAFGDALDTLDDVRFSDARGDAMRTWQYLHSANVIHCALLVGDVARARAVYDDDLEPSLLSGPGAEVIRREAEAKLAYFEGRLDEAREQLSALADDDRITSASRALYRHFLGRVAADSGDEDAAKAHRAAASELAPRMFFAGADRDAADDAS